jgi:ferredoxin
VNVTFVNYAGDRTRLPGRVGDTLLDVAKRYNYNFVDGACGGGGAPVEKLHKEGKWLEPKYGEGAQCYFCHVIIPKSHYDALPAKRPDELAQLAQYPFPEDMTDTYVQNASVANVPMIYGGARGGPARLAHCCRRSCHVCRPHATRSLDAPANPPLQFAVGMPGALDQGNGRHGGVRAGRAAVRPALNTKWDCASG